MRVTGRRPVSLHVWQPGRSLEVRASKSTPQFSTHFAGAEVLRTHLLFLPLEVYFAMLCKQRLRLVFEEGVVQDLVVDIQLALLRIHALSQLLTNHFASVTVNKGIPKLCDTCLLDVIWQLEGILQYTSLILQVFPLLGPVSRHSD